MMSDVKPHPEYLRMALSFRDQFANISSSSLREALRELRTATSYELTKQVFEDRALKIGNEEYWSFMSTSAMLVIMTELENRRGVKPD